MGIQAALGSDIALVFDECTPYHADLRLHSAVDRADPPLAGPVPRVARERGARRARRSSGSSRAASTRSFAGLGRARKRRGGRRHRDRRHARPRQGRDARACSSMTVPLLPATHRSTCSGSASPTTSSTASPSASTSSTARCRLGWAGTAWRSRHCPDDRFRLNVRHRRWPRTRARSSRGARARHALRHTRAYLHYLSRAEELTAVRLLTLHNLTYLERLVEGARDAIGEERYGDYPQRRPCRSSALGRLTATRVLSPTRSLSLSI